MSRAAKTPRASAAPEHVVTTTPAPLDALVRTAEVIVTCGSGGVGKTTTAAAIAMQAARNGRRTVVVTIDPARRLADALGLTDGLDNEPAPITAPGTSANGGSLWAMMLDPTRTFDELIQSNASTPERADRILANGFYRSIAGKLSGTQEFMAAEKLYQLHLDDRFDLVVVDTPPTRNALNFLDAPATLTRFIDHKLFRLIMLPARSSFKVLNLAAQPLLRTIGKVVGGEVVADAIEFFQAFDGMESGFRDRAQTVTALLRSDATAYVLVASPRHDTVDEATFFADRLSTSELSVSAVVVNRLHPRFGTMSTATAVAKAAAVAKSKPGRRALWQNLAELGGLADAEESVIAPLSTIAGAEAIVRVPLLRDDVHSVEGLSEMAGHLFAGLASTPCTS